MSNRTNTINATDNVYRVVGRYMTGSTVSGYHLVGIDGSQVKASKDRAIYMIGRGLIENMRVQSSESGVIVRGKGVNLNMLPVYDLNKDAFRDNKYSQDAANTNVQPKKDSGINPMGQMEITKRIMYKTTCLGYMVKDRSGKEIKLSRDKVIELAVQRLISNATVQKYTDRSTGKTRLILRGAGSDLTELPALIVDSTGRIVDPNKVDSNTKMRVVRMKRGGIVYNKEKDKKYTFETGDYLVCGNNAVIRPMNKSDALRKLKVDTEGTSAICDVSLENLVNYPIEIFGNKVQTLSKEQVLTWQIVSIANSK